MDVVLGGRMRAEGVVGEEEGEDGEGGSWVWMPLMSAGLLVCRCGTGSPAQIGREACSVEDALIDRMEWKEERGGYR